MFKFSTFVLFGLVVSVVAYNFDDQDFNSFLDDFADIRSAKTKRDIADNHLHGSKFGIFCCNGDKTEPWSSFMKMKRECTKEVFGKWTVHFMDYNHFDCKVMRKLRSDIICVGACIARKANLTDGEGGIDREALLAYVKSKVEEIEWQKATAEKNVDRCLAEVNEEKGGKCSLLPLKLAYCIWTQFVQSCPAKLHSNTKACKDIREKLA